MRIQDEATPSAARRLREAFDALVDLPPAQRALWLDANVSDPAQRVEVVRLLAADDSGGYLDTPVMERAARFAAEDIVPGTLVGTRIGAFRLLREIGRGGMAAVFLAERDEGDVRQRVAVKLLRRGLYSEIEQRLFLRERQLLASLEHPNIARLIDAGVTAAHVPYLVMEFVDGVPITEFANAAHLDIRARLRLFIDACDAVAAAHQRLIVHRDIKPSNILVSGDGQVKLLDFGIAKLVEDDVPVVTATRGAFTPEYAAPEQRDGGLITTATDVYGLGLLLHELLSGHRPGVGSVRKPSSLVADDARDAAAQSLVRRARKQLRGDLDNIVLKALAEEPARRYASASALSDDIERYLDGRPVKAHPPSGWYSAVKFVRRHRRSVVVAAVAVLAIIVSMSLVVWQARVASAEAKRANAVRNFVESIFEPLRKGTPENKQPRISELLAAATARLDHADLDATARLDMLQMFSNLNEKIAESATAQRLADRAYMLAKDEFGRDNPVTLDALVSRGLIALHRDDIEAAAPMLKEAERRYRQQNITGASLIRLYDGLAVLADAKGDDPHKTVTYERAALAQRIATAPDDKSGLGTGYNNLGYGLESLGDFEGAAKAYRKAYGLAAATQGADSAETAVTLSNLGSAEMLAGHLRAAREDLERAKIVLGNAGGKVRPIQVANAQQRCVLEMTIDPFAAEAACAADLRMTADAEGSTSADYGLALRRQSLLALERGDLGAAQRLLAHAATLIEPAVDAVWQGRVDITQGELQLLAGKPKEAARLLHRGLGRIGGSYPPHLRKYGSALLALACDGIVSDDCPADAFTAASQEVDTASYRGSAILLPAQVALARVDLAHGRAQAAAQRLQAAIQGAEGEVADTAPRLIAAKAWLARALAALGRCADAGLTYQRAHEVAVADDIVEHPLIADVLSASPVCVEK